MKKTNYILHDFNLELFLYSLPKKSTLKKHFNLTKNKFVNIDSISKSMLEKVNIYWGNRINEKILSQLNNLEWVQFGSSGINEKLKHIFQKRKIIVSNSKGLYDEAITNLVFGFIFGVGSGVLFSQKIKEQQMFDRTVFETNSNNLFEIKNKKILILGYGSISQYLIKKLKHFNKHISILTNRKLGENDKKNFINTYSYKQINLAFEKNDLIINILPDNKQTDNIVNKSSLNKLSKRSFLINVGRGNTVNLKDIFSLIKKNKGFIYATDVFPKKEYIDPYRPISKNHIILKNQNIITTPHIGAYHESYWTKEINLFSSNLNLYLQKKKLINQIKI